MGSSAIQAMQLHQDEKKISNLKMFSWGKNEEEVSITESSIPCSYLLIDRPDLIVDLINSDIFADEKKPKSESEAAAGIHEAPIGKGLGGVLELLRSRGILKKKRKFVEIGGGDGDGDADADAVKEIVIERRDEFGRIMTPKEAFRRLSHKFHGKGPGLKKQEKRMRRYLQELKMKKMETADTPSFSAQRLREELARIQSPYLVLF